MHHVRNIAVQSKQFKTDILVLFIAVKMFSHVEGELSVAHVNSYLSYFGF